MATRGPSSPRIVVAMLVATACGSAVVRLVAAAAEPSLLPTQTEPTQTEPVDALAGPPIADADGDAILDAIGADGGPGPRGPDGSTTPPRDLIDDNGGGCGCDPTGRPERGAHASSLWLANVAAIARSRRARDKNRAGRP